MVRVWSLIVLAIFGSAIFGIVASADNGGQNGRAMVAMKPQSAPNVAPIATATRPAATPTIHVSAVLPMPKPITAAPVSIPVATPIPPKPSANVHACDDLTQYQPSAALMAQLVARNRELIAMNVAQNWTNAQFAAEHAHTSALYLADCRARFGL